MTRSGEYRPQLEKEGFRTIPWNISRPSLNPLREVYSFFQVLRAYRIEKPDLVHHIALKPIIYGGIAARFRGAIPSVNTVTGLGLVFTSSSPLMHVLRRILSTVLKWACRFPNSKVVVQNEDDRELLMNQRIAPAEQLVVIPGFGVNTKQFVPRPESEDTPVVMLPARMLWEKGVLEFVTAAKELRNRSIAARMVLVGAPDPFNKGCIPEVQLRAWAKSGVVEWWGQRDNMHEVLSQANVVCLPSYREGLPKVLLEAAACGRAIVTTNAPGCAHAVRNGENGFLVPVKDPQTLVTAISTLLQSPSLRRQMGAAGRKRVMCELSEEQIASQTLRIYAELMKGKWHFPARLRSEQEEEVFAET